MSWPGRCLRVASVACGLTWASSAAGQDIATAEALFNRGIADMEAGRYTLGCGAIGESHRLDPRPGTLFTLAVCEERWGRIATAVTRYGDYLALQARLPEDRRAAQGERPGVARVRRAQLAAEVPELILELPPGAPPGTVVTRDGQVMAQATLGVGLPVDPGEHTVTVQAPGEPAHEQHISLDRGEKKRVMLEVRGAPGVEPPSPPSSSPPSPAGGTGLRRGLTFAVGGVGAASLVAGGVLGALALGQRGVLRQHCGSAIKAKDDTACDPTGLAAAESARRLGVASSATFVIGLGGVGAAVALRLTEKGPERAKVSGVLEVGPFGAMVGARGRW